MTMTYVEAIEYLGLTDTDRPSHEDIRTRYRSLAKMYHPDLGGSNTKFIKLRMAYDVAMSATPVNSSAPTPPTHRHRTQTQTIPIMPILFLLFWVAYAYIAHVVSRSIGIYPSTWHIVAAFAVIIFCVLVYYEVDVTGILLLALCIAMIALAVYFVFMPMFAGFCNNIHGVMYEIEIGLNLIESTLAGF